MRTYAIEYQDKGTVKVEFIRAVTASHAIKALCNALRIRGNRVMLKVSRISQLGV